MSKNVKRKKIMNTEFETKWISDKNLIITRLKGEVNEREVKEWNQSLQETFGKLSNNSKFKVLIELFGFQARSLEVHKQYREIIPLSLANFGWKVGYVDMFERKKDLVIKSERGIQCVAAVHVHHDETKINRYEELYSRENEHFWTDLKKAEEWIRNYSTR